MVVHDPLREAFEIREKLASEKRKLAFFFGAGTSMAVGIPGINTLTEKVSEDLEEPFKAQFQNVRKKFSGNANVENVLDRIRSIRELMGDSEEEVYDSIKGATDVKLLDSASCQAISKIVSRKPSKEIKPHLILAQWLRSLHVDRLFPVEIFTTNYDLLFEQAMEHAGVPFFDGFIGAVHPFFTPESVEAEENKISQSAYPPRTWTRLWKIHGSINWLMLQDAGKKRVTRLSGLEPKKGEELMIFPSREKYIESRKLPFITFQDRLRKFLSTGESLFIIAGYNFSDEHINEIIFQGLRSNPRLSIMALMYGDEKVEAGKSKLVLSDKIIQYGQEHRNLIIYGPDRACIGGIVASWGEPGRKKKDTEIWPFWDDSSKSFTLGEFSSFTSYLEVFIGFRTSNICPLDTQPPTESKGSSSEA